MATWNLPVQRGLLGRWLSRKLDQTKEGDVSMSMHTEPVVVNGRAIGSNDRRPVKPAASSRPRLVLPREMPTTEGYGEKPYIHVGYQRMSPAEWAAVPKNPKQRDEARRVAEGRANHLLSPDEVHREVCMAKLPDGSLYKIDGHTRDYVWTAGLVAPPAELLVKVYLCRDIEAVKDLYARYDNTATGKIGVDHVAGAYREVNIEPSTPMLARGGISTAMRGLYHLVTRTSPRPETKDFAINKAISWFADEIMLLDEAKPQPLLFPTGFVMGSLLTLKRRGRDGLDFWTQYAAGGGTKVGGRIDAVQALLERHQKFKGRTNGTRDTLFANYCVAAHEGWRRGDTYAATSGVSQRSRDIFRRYINDAMGSAGGTSLVVVKKEAA